MRVGSLFYKHFNKFLKPSFYFTCYINNPIIANIYPNLIVPKTTVSSPKYFFFLKGIFEAFGKTTKFLLPKFFYKNISGLRFLLFFKNYEFLKSNKGLEIKKIFYKKNYLLISSLLAYTNYNQFNYSLKVSKVSTISSIRSLLVLLFVNF